MAVKSDPGTQGGVGVDYSRNTVDSTNPIKRWLHRSRLSASVNLLQLQGTECVLDYGCGSGELSHRVSTQFPAAQITAFDPAAELFGQARRRLADCPNVALTNSFEAIPESFDRVACLEVVEHLPPVELAAALLDIQIALKPAGYCLFTFPIEHGVMSLAKNVYRRATGGDLYPSAGRAARSFLGLSVPRQDSAALSDCSYIYSHVGFDCRAMLDTIADSFSIEAVHVLPLGTVTLGLGNGLAVIARRPGA